LSIESNTARRYMEMSFLYLNQPQTCQGSNEFAISIMDTRPEINVMIKTIREIRVTLRIIRRFFGEIAGCF